MKKRGEIKRLVSFGGSTYIGLFAVCTDSLVLLPSQMSDKLVQDIERALNVKSIRATIAETALLGCFAVGNSNGFIISPYALDSEIESLAELLDAAGLKVKISRMSFMDRMTTAGNIIMANDSVALVHPQLSDKTVDVITETLDVKVYKGTIGRLNTVGAAAVATNRGVLVHKNATQSELEFLEEIFELPVGIGSVNFGLPLIGAALIANSKGYVAGYETTGAELGRIEDALGF